LLEPFRDCRRLSASDELLVPPSGLNHRLAARENALSELAAIKQDPKDFGYRMMVKERDKRATLEPLYGIAKALPLTLSISQ
jgi:hypothetical protein